MSDPSVGTSVFDFMTAAQQADVIARTYTLDVAPAIEAAVLSVYNAGGGTVCLPAGGYLLATTSTAPNSLYSYVTLRDGVNIVGNGKDATVLKVAAGENARFNGTTGPNALATKQATPLKNCTFRDFTVDWNGANNLLTSSTNARNNASILSLNGGINIICSDIKAMNVPGNQCIFFPASTEQGQGNIRLIRCEALNCGSGLVGNYNIDHSSFYCNGTGLRYEDLRGDAPQRVAGALFELHGGDAQAVGCYSNFYERGFWIASNYQAISGIKVSRSVHTNVNFAFSMSAQQYAIDNVEIASCDFTQADGLTPSPNSFFINGNTIAASSSVHVHDCKFIGKGYNMRMFQLFQLSRLIFEDNYSAGFAGYGIHGNARDIGGKRWIQLLRVINNTFDDVVNAVYCNVPEMACDVVDIRGNIFNRSVADTNAPVTFSSTTSTGVIGPNIKSANYTKAFAGYPNGAKVFYAETGTWQPTVAGSVVPGTCTYTTQAGQYTQVGNMVFFETTVTWSGHTGTGGITVSLPVAPVLSVPNVTVAANTEGVAVTAGKYVGARIYPNNGMINLFEFSSGAISLLTMSAAGTVSVSGQYPCT